MEIASTPTEPAVRIVSLLPSATELLWAVGAHAMLVGRSHECDFPNTGPDSVLGLPALTAARTHYSSSSALDVDRQVRQAIGTRQSLYTLDETLLTELRPDLLVTQDLCSVCSIDLAAVQRAASRLTPPPRVLSLNPRSLEDVFEDLIRLGEAVGRPQQAREAVLALRGRFYAACDYVNAFDDGPCVAFLEWTDPLFVGGHWTPQLIERAGGRHPLNPSIAKPTAGAGAGPTGMTLREAGRSVTVSSEVLCATRPEVVIVAPCGLSLAQARAEAHRLADQAWFRDLPAFRKGRVAVVDGNQMFNRPGPRLIDAFEFLVGYLNNRPEVIPSDMPWEPLR